MRAISASIVVLAGAIAFSSGAHVAHSDTALFVMAAGGLTALLGLGAWIYALGLKE